MKKWVVGLMCAFSSMSMASTGIGLFAGNPYWGAEVKINQTRINLSLDDQFGFGVNRTYGVSNTPLYLFIGGNYVDRQSNSIAITPGIGAKMNVSPMVFYADVGPNLYLDEFNVNWEAKIGFHVLF